MTLSKGQHPVEGSRPESFVAQNQNAITDSVGKRRKSRMVLIPSGTFLMGSSNGSPAEAPEHQVDLPDFWLDQTPVTNNDYAEFVDDSGYRTEVEQAGFAWGVIDGSYQQVAALNWKTYLTPGREEHPVVLVTWNDA